MQFIAQAKHERLRCLAWQAPKLEQHRPPSQTVTLIVPRGKINGTTIVTKSRKATVFLIGIAGFRAITSQLCSDMHANSSFPAFFHGSPQEVLSFLFNIQTK